MHSIPLSNELVFLTISGLFSDMFQGQESSLRLFITNLVLVKCFHSLQWFGDHLAPNRLRCSKCKLAFIHLVS